MAFFDKSNPFLLAQGLRIEFRRIRINGRELSTYRPLPCKEAMVALSEDFGESCYYLFTYYVSFDSGGSRQSCPGVERMSVSQKSTETKTSPSVADSASTAATQPSVATAIASDSVKDPGKVHIGAGLMRF